MLRTLTIIAAFLVGVVPAFAQISDLQSEARKADRQARIDRALADLPSRADVDALLDSLPDITGAMTGLMDVATNDDNQKTLEGLIGRLDAEVSSVEAELNNGSIPDLTGMMERFARLSTDREFMGDALDLMFQVQDVMTDALPEQGKP